MAALLVKHTDVRSPGMKITPDPSQIRAREATTRDPFWTEALGNPKQEEKLPKDGINSEEVQVEPKCPVCINIPRPPIYNSYTGLIIGGGCKDVSALEKRTLIWVWDAQRELGRGTTPATIFSIIF
ncbi:unnamed protein product [Allacma fusca]|uniref:Uncharacterized protein n=1 Tax=Allacma fusca TaxID=39272 RepID=A0A8J2K4Q6_9HEXA|nr:unnamed protein product [Allacma fusca]